MYETTYTIYIRRGYIIPSRTCRRRNERTHYTDDITTKLRTKLDIISHARRRKTRRNLKLYSNLFLLSTLHVI